MPQLRNRIYKRESFENVRIEKDNNIKIKTHYGGSIAKEANKEKR